MPRKKADPEIVQAESSPPDIAPEPSPKAQESTAAPSARTPRRRAADDENILRLNEEELGFTSEDSEEAKWNYLADAVRRKQILTGIVSNVEYANTKSPACAVDFEGMRVLIPIREMVTREWPQNEDAPRSVQLFLQRILGATVDFVPAAVDIRNRAAVGSRKAAMLIRQKQYYESGRVKPGILVACRVLAVGSTVMTVEACGVDSTMQSRNVSWEWFSDITELYSTGDIVVARVIGVEFNEEQNRYSVDLSIKAATSHSDKAAFEKLVPNSNYFGVVTGVKNGIFFVRLQLGVNAKTKIFRGQEYPCKQDTVSFRVTQLDEDSLVANGYITRIIKRHTRLR